MNLTRNHAIARDQQDPLAKFRERFFFPRRPDGQPVIYLCGNSLGLQPKGVREALNVELDDWANLGVDGHFDGTHPWFAYHDMFRRPLAHIMGAKEHEVAALGSLTNNLHLLMVSFYRPTPKRYKILIEASAFPSDQYAVESQVRFHGFDPADAVVEFQPREGEHTLRTKDIEKYLEEHGQDVALVMFSGVNYLSGQAFDMGRITAAGHRAGARVGFDLAHAAGNLELRLHEWGADFAAWCSYKYMNSGPGGVSGIFVHERHADSPELPRFAGWWGNDPATRFKMEPGFRPAHGADGWQLSNAPILSLAAHKISLDLFEEATMPALRAKTVAITEYLLALLDALPNQDFEVITPREPEARGAQISLRMLKDGRAFFERLQAAGVVCDFREPDVIRVAPAPLYCSFEDVWQFTQILAS
jgi:kynureninase